MNIVRGYLTYFFFSPPKEKQVLKSTVYEFRNLILSCLISENPMHKLYC
jgi:hypothetical protein